MNELAENIRRNNSAIRRFALLCRKNTWFHRREWKRKPG